MRDKKYYIALDDFERRVVVNCLNEIRNNLSAYGDSGTCGISSKIAKCYILIC